MDAALQTWFPIVMRDLSSDHEDEQVQQEVCVTNISPEERRKRLHIGIVYFGIGIAVFIAMILFRIDPLWRLGLFPIFSAAASTIFQWRDKT